MPAVPRAVSSPRRGVGAAPMSFLRRGVGAAPVRRPSRPARLPVLLGRVALGMLAGAATAFLVALLRPQPRGAAGSYVAPVPPGELRV